MFSSNTKIDYDSLENFSSVELEKIFDDLAYYAVQSFTTPKKRMPFKLRKYGCYSYEDAGKFYDRAVAIYNKKFANKK